STTRSAGTRSRPPRTTWTSTTRATKAGRSRAAATSSCRAGRSSSAMASSPGRRAPAGSSSAPRPTTHAPTDRAGGLMGAIDARFGHVNVTGRDWRRLAAFYTDVFGCEFVPPERAIRSAALAAATGLHDAHLTGAHLRLPGHGDGGPTLEIFSYDALAEHPEPRVDRPGWGHVAFQVADVPAALDAVHAAGGGRL